MLKTNDASVPSATSGREIGSTILTSSNRRFSNQRFSYPQIVDSQIGFTLIELLVVASILVVLAGIGLVQYKNGVTRAREGVLKTDLFNIRDAIDQYYADKGQYPGTLDELVSAGYLRKVPDDPFTTTNSTWQTIQSEPDAANPTAAPGVYDVKSGSDQTALDGSKYSDW